MESYANGTGTRPKAVWGSRVRLLAALVLAVGTASCGDVVRDGTGSSYLAVLSLTGASGAEPQDFGGTLNSDVITIVDDNATIFNDLGRATFRLLMKDPGGVGNPTEPSSANFITLNRYTVTYRRADGRNTPGVDVPYPIDDAVTVTVDTNDTTASFTIVRHTAKSEAPLAALRGSLVIIATIAEVTFYGRDQTGRDVSVTGTIGIHFGNFGDPSS
jgi:hypothetical protein